MKPYTGYEFLGFILPGLLVLAIAYYGWHGWSHGEPGPTAVLGIAAAAYIVGHVVAAAANWLAPLAWGQLPGRRVSSFQGLRGGNGKYVGVSDDQLLEWLGADAEQDPQRAFDLAYTRIRQHGDTTQLDILNEQIGFYRNGAVAGLLGTVIVITLELVAGGAGTLPALTSAPVLALVTLAFCLRYRRFWTRFGDYVIRITRT